MGVQALQHIQERTLPPGPPVAPGWLLLRSGVQHCPQDHKLNPEAQPAEGRRHEEDPAVPCESEPVTGNDCPKLTNRRRAPTTTRGC